jgi:hypothetical protein
MRLGVRKRYRVRTRTFRGRCRNPNLVMDDHGSISNYSEFDAACATCIGELAFRKAARAVAAMGMRRAGPDIPPISARGLNCWFPQPFTSGPRLFALRSLPVA